MDDQGSALFVQLYNQNLPGVREILATGVVHVDTRYVAACTHDLEHGETALHIACGRNWPEMVQLLLEFGADTEARTPGNLTPLWVAIDNGFGSDIVEILSNNGADINARTGANNGTVLHLAAHHHGPDTITKLITHDADVTITNEIGHSPLHYSPLPENVPVFIKAGLSANVQDYRGNTPLHYFNTTFSDTHEYHEVDGERVEALILAGADIHMPNKAGQTSLEYGFEVFANHEDMTDSDMIDGIRTIIRAYAS